MSFVFHFIYYMSIGNYFRIVFIIFLNKINKDILARIIYTAFKD